MIWGVGIDLTDVDRMEREVSRRGDAFLREFLTEPEIFDCAFKRRPFPSYAARFAAKEAFSKALGTGMMGSISWHDVEVRLGDQGEPLLHLRGTARREASACRITSVHLSLCHERTLAAAVVVLESADESVNLPG